MKKILRMIKTKTPFGLNIDVMRNASYVGNIRVHRGEIICNPVVNHCIQKEIILYEHTWDGGERLSEKEYWKHIDNCKDKLTEFIKSNKRKETKDESK